MNGEVRRLEPGMIDRATSRWRVLCRPSHEPPEKCDAAFAWVNANGKVLAYSCAWPMDAATWQLGLYAGDLRDREALVELLRAVGEAVHEGGGSSIHSLLDLATSPSFQVFHDAGLALISLLSCGGEAAAVFGFDPHRVQPSPKASLGIGR